MTPIVSLRFLQEPAYVLLGGLLADDGSGRPRVIVSPDSIVQFPPEAGPALRYFATLRSRSDAIRAIGEWDGSPDDLDALVAAGTLVGFPANDEHGVREVLTPLTVRVTADAALASDGRSVLLRLPTDRAVVIDPVTAAVLQYDAPRALGAAVRGVAASLELDEDAVWRGLVHDLTGVLTSGAGHLAKARIR